MEHQTNNERSVDALFADILKHEPKPIASFVPADAAEQREAFLSGEQEEPTHHYNRLAEIDFAAKDEIFARLAAEIAKHTAIPDRYKPIYGEFIDRYRRVNQLMQVATLYSDPETDKGAKAHLAEEYARLNEALYGGVDHETHAGLVTEKMTKIKAAAFDDEVAIGLRQELMDLLPADLVESESTAFRPSPETVAAMQHMVQELYGELLKHVPDEERSYGPYEVAWIFQQIIDQEFGEVAAGWRVEVTKAKSINVIAGEKLIRVPDDRAPVTGMKLKGLIAHELGVHFLRAVRGSETDLLPMQVGFPDYYDQEEGLGKVMEQAVEGRFETSGIPYYIIAGFMDRGDSFRDVFEKVWRMNVLEAAADGTEINEALVAKKRTAAYNSVMRIARGTDALPWMKDLAYYNGAVDMWRYFEKHAGDELMLNVALIGKIDPTNLEHVRLAMSTNIVETQRAV